MYFNNLKSFFDNEPLDCPFFIKTISHTTVQYNFALFFKDQASWLHNTL